MGKSELASAQADWNKRVAKYEQAGIPNSVWAPIAQRDLSRTYTSGSVPMTNAEADTAVYAAWQQINPIAEAPRHRSGLFGGLDTILSNIIPDVSNIITSLPRGIETLGKDLVSPKQWEATGHDLAQAFDAMIHGNIGAEARDLASSPLLSLIPGVADIGALTTEQGRIGLEQHPVTAALDILPIAKPLTAAAGVAVAGDAASEALRTSLADASLLKQLRGRVNVTGQDPSALAALVAGKPLKAAIRGVDRKVTSKALGELPEGLGAIQRQTNKALKALKLDQRNRALSAELNRSNLIAEGDVRHKVTEAEMNYIFAQLADEAALESYTTKANMGDTASMTPEELAVHDKVQELRTRLEDQGIEKGEGTRLDIGYYATDSPVVRAHKRRDRMAARHEKRVQDRLTAQKRYQETAVGLRRVERIAKSAPKQRTAELLRSGQVVVKAQKDLKAAQEQFIRDRNQYNGLDLNRTHARVAVAARAKMDASRSLMEQRERFLKQSHRNFSHIHANTPVIRTVHRHLIIARREHNSSILALQKATKAQKMMARALKKSDENLQRKIILDPPAHLHEWIRSHMRDRVAKAYMANQGEAGISTARIRELTQAGEYAKVLKDIASAPFMDRYYEYIGHDETKALFEDTVREALKLSDQGIAPMYMHRLRAEDMDHLHNVHVAAERDMTEAQYRHRAFNMQSSVMNMRAAMTREMINTIERDAMQKVYNTAIAPHEVTHAAIWPTYLKAAEANVGKFRYMDKGQIAQHLLEREWTKFDFERFGVQRPGTVAHTADVYIPKSMAQNLESYGTYGGKVANSLSKSWGYNRVMGVFRTSVLYGPRHFAHVVIGGLMPLMLDQPMSLLEARNLMGYFTSIARKGRTPLTHANGVEIPEVIGAHFDYRTDTPYKMLQTKIGNSYARLLKDYWEKTGGRFGEGMARFENAAQSLYQAISYTHDIKRGVDPVVALEHARRLVVNLDTMAPFERTIFKQVFPFYSFTRFAVNFLLQLPFDHPLRVAVLSQLSKQAQEEWGTGLPQTMMSLFFIGHPNSNGSINTINYRNMNPFRSVASMFTMAGFMMSLNPILQAPFIASGFNPLSGTGQLYPEIVYDAQTGTLTAARPKGDLMLAAEAFTPELGAIDSYFGISDNLRTLKATDQGAFDRELLNMFNIPFAWSRYNMPQTRGKVAENAYKGAQNAVTAYKKGNNFQDTIGRYALVPYQGYLVTPEQFKQYWEQEKAALQPTAPGAAISALIPKPPAHVTDTLAQLVQHYQH